MSGKFGGKATLRICDTCPFLKKNHGKPHKDGWYSKRNLRRLWNGLRTGRAPGMICHSTDPKNIEYGGDANIKPGIEAECGGAVYCIIRNVNAIGEGKPHPMLPPMTKSSIARWVERFFFGHCPEVTTDYQSEEIGIPE